MPPRKKPKPEPYVPPPPLPSVVWQALRPDGARFGDLPAAQAAVAEQCFKLGRAAAQVGAPDGPVTIDTGKMTLAPVAGGGPARPLRRIEAGVWQWKDDQGIWATLADDDSATLEHAWRALPPGGGAFKTKNLTWNEGFDSLYTFTFTVDKTQGVSAVQRNEESGTERGLKRSDAAVVNAVFDTASFGINALKPVTEADAAAAAATQLQAPPGRGGAGVATGTAAPLAKELSTGVGFLTPPDYWLPQNKSLQFFSVPGGSAEYTSVVTPFIKTIGGCSGSKKPAPTILSVQRIQNQPLWSFYAMTRHRVALHNAGDANEMTRLFHGCRVRQNMDAIIEFGFDMRVARDGLAGVGIYFATTSGYSDCGYVLENKDKSREIIVCRVAVGTFAQGKSGMKRPPVRSGKGVNAELHDSVARLPQMHVVFDNTQAYPEYVIKYRHGKNK